MLLLVLLTSAQAEEIEVGEASPRTWHWLAPLDPVNPFTSSDDPFHNVNDSEREHLTPEMFRKLSKMGNGEFLWIMVYNQSTRKHYRYVISVEEIFEEIDPGQPTDPFSQQKLISKNYYITSQHTLSKGQFQSSHRVRIGDGLGDAFHLLGQHMTKEVGYPGQRAGIAPRLSPLVCFGYQNNGEQFFGEGAVPAGANLEEFRSLFWALGHFLKFSGLEADPFGEDSDDGRVEIEALIRRGCGAERVTEPRK